MTQPDTDLLLQHRTIVLRIASPAMNEQDTSLPGGVGSGQKLLHNNFGLFHGMAMQVNMRLDRIIATVQALRQTSIDSWGKAFHILIRVLNRKLPAPFDEVTQVRQGFVVVSRIERLGRQCLRLLHSAPWVLGQRGHTGHLGQKHGFLPLHQDLGRPRWRGGRRGWCRSWWRCRRGVPDGA